MREIEKRINYLKKAINTLRAIKCINSSDELNRIVSICDYQEELEALERIQRESTERVKRAVNILYGKDGCLKSHDDKIIRKNDEEWAIAVYSSIQNVKAGIDIDEEFSWLKKYTDR